MHRSLQRLMWVGVLGASFACGEALRPLEPLDESTLHVEATPTEPSGMAIAPGAAPEPARPAPPKECSTLAGPRRGLEIERLQVKGIIIGSRNNVALVADSRGKTQPVRVGEYVGSRCWKVASVGTEWVTVQRERNGDGSGVEIPNVRLYVNDPPRRELAGR